MKIHKRSEDRSQDRKSEDIGVKIDKRSQDSNQVSHLNNSTYGKKCVFLIENLNEIVPKLGSHWGLGQEPHWESRTSSRTSSKIKNLIKNLIKNQNLGQDLIEILIENLNERRILNSQWGSCPRPHWLRSYWDLNFGTISLRFSMRKTKFFRKNRWTLFQLIIILFNYINDLYRIYYNLQITKI